MILEMGTNRSINQYANSNSIEVASAVSTTTKAVDTREEDSKGNNKMIITREGDSKGDNKMRIIIIIITIRGVPKGEIETTVTTVDTRMIMEEMEDLWVKMRDNSSRQRHIATSESLQ